MTKLLVGIALSVFLSLGVATQGARADEGQVDVLLVLATDVSRSVDDREYNL